MKRRTILSSILVIIACIAVISGTTFALFTSESSVNIAITSGKVNVVATLDTLECYSATADTTIPGLDTSAKNVAGEITSGPFAGTYYYKVMPVVNNTNTKGTFANGGTATLTNTKTLEIDRITPGDKVEVTVNVENQSNVITKYRVRVNVLDGETLEDQAKSLKLFEGLVVKVGTDDEEERTATTLDGVIRVSDWYDLAARGDNDNLADVPVEIFLPLEAGNEYQDLKTEIQITVEAVQSNAHTASLDEINKVLTLSTNVKNNTMYDAIQEVITAKPSYKEEDFYPYVWNVDTDRFYDESSIDGNFFYKYFKAYTQAEYAALTKQTYSIYAKPNWTAPVSGLTVGFDAGNATGITSVTYDRSTESYGRDVVIRTNSAFTNLTVNAPLDVLYHYGETGTASINAIAGNSYHEYGKVAFLEISKGRVALEADAEVSNIHIVSKKEVVNEVEQTTNKFDEIVIAIDENTTKPTFSRDDVKISTQGTLVVAIQTGTEEITEDTKLDYVWLTKQGIFEQIKVSDNSESMEDAIWADHDSLNDTNTQEAAIEIANNIGRADVNDKKSEIKVEVAVTKEDAYFVEEKKTYKVILDGNRDLVVVEKDDDLKTPVATLVTTSTVQIGTAQFTVALTSTNNNKEAELTVTNVSDPTEVHKADAVTNGGLTEDQITEVKTEVVDEAKIEEVSNNDKYVARIGTVGYNEFETALEEANNNTIVLLVDCEYTPSSDIVFVVDENENDFTLNVVNTDEFAFNVETSNLVVGTRYTISKFVPAAKIGNNYYASFADALVAVGDGQTIILLADAEFGSQITISNNLGIDLLGHTLAFLPSGNNSYWGPSAAAFRINAGGTLNLKDTADDKGQFVIKPPYTCTLTFAYNYGTMNLNSLIVLLDIENYNENVDTTKWSTTCATNRANVNGISNYGTLNVVQTTINNASKGGTTSIMNYGNLNMESSVLNITGNSASSYGINSNKLNSSNVVSTNTISNSTINILEKGQGLTFTKSIATVTDCTINMSGTESMSASSAYGIYVGKSAIAVGEPEVLINGNTNITAYYSSYGAQCITVNAGHVVIEEDVVVDAGDNGYALRFGASALAGFENAAQLEVKGGTYSGEVSSWSTNGTMVITGGTYDDDPSAYVDLSKYYIEVVNEKYVVKPFTNTTPLAADGVARIGSVGYMTLQAAVEDANTDEIVVLLKDIDLVNAYNIAKSVTINGGGHTVRASNETGGYSSGNEGRVFNVQDTSNLIINLANIKIQGESSGVRGISIYNNTNLNLTLSNCNVSANYYAINVASLNENLQVTLTNNTFSTGWCAIQSWSPNAVFNIVGGTLEGNNDKPYNAEGYNDFSTIVINNLAKNNTWNFKDVTIKANATSGNKQTLLSNRANGTVISFDDCIFVSNESDLSDLQEIVNNCHLSRIPNSMIIDKIELITRVPDLYYTNNTAIYENGDITSSSTSDEMNTYFEYPFINGWLANGEGVKLLSDVKLESDIELQMTSGSIYLIFNGHTITGGQIVLYGTTSVISENGTMSNVFKGNVNVVDNGNGTYTYSLGE